MRRPTSALLLSFAVAAVQAAPVDEDSTLTDDAGETSLEEITVTATRTERAVFATPAAVTTLGRGEILDAQAYSYQDLFKDVPGTLTVGGPRRISEEPMIRGFQDEQVVIRVNGARQNFNQAHRGRFFLDPNLLKDIEVLRGTSSAAYGSGAMGGVISLVTMDPDDFLHGEDGAAASVGSSYQSNGSALGLYGSTWGQAGMFDVLASVASRELDDDLEDGDGTVLAATRDEVQNGLLKLGLDLSPHHRVELAASAFENQGRNPPNANVAATPTNLVDRDTEYDSYSMSYDLHDPGNALLDLHAVLYRNDAAVDEFRLDDGRRDHTDFVTEGLEIYNTSRFPLFGDREASLTYGIESYTDEQSGTRNAEARPEFPDAEAEYRAFFVQAELPITERLDLIPSLRNDRFEYDSSGDFPARDDDQLTPRLSLGFEATDDFYLWGGYAEAFRAPSLTELYASGVHFVAPIGPGQVVINEFVPTPNLQPELADTLEAGFRWRLEHDAWGMNVSATAWQSDVDNFVEQFVIFISGPPEFDPVTQTLVFPGITSNRNVSAELKGLEAGLDWRAGDWSGGLSATVVDGENVETGEPLASIPQDQVVLKLSRSFADRNLRLGGRLTLAADRDDLPEGMLPAESWQTLDLFLGWSPSAAWLEGFDLRAGVDNALDETYRVHPNGINAPGRTYKLSVAVRFGS